MTPRTHHGDLGQPGGCPQAAGAPAVGSEEYQPRDQAEAPECEGVRGGGHREDQERQRVLQHSSGLPVQPDPLPSSTGAEITHCLFCQQHKVSTDYRYH